MPMHVDQHILLKKMPEAANHFDMNSYGNFHKHELKVRCEVVLSFLVSHIISNVKLSHRILIGPFVCVRVSQS